MTAIGEALAPTTVPVQFELTPDEAGQLQEAVRRLLREVGSSQDPELYRLAPLTARFLPPRLLEFLSSFRRQEPAGALVIRGWHVDDVRIGPTPEHWRDQHTPSPTLAEELYFVLAASVLGDVFAWSTVQDGRLVQDLLPIKGEELHKSAGSSGSVLDLHNEDAFSPLRCDYLGLFCLRNDDLIPTSYAALNTDGLTPEQRRVLAEPRYVLTPDTEHVRRAVERGELPPAPPKTGLLFGDPQRPYLAIDEFFIEVDPLDEEALDALNALLHQLRSAQQDVALRPGELLIIDNYRAVHGRQPFQARYDGRDRWLKRLGVTRDLRKSRAARSSTDSPVIITGLASLA
jgi:Fe(II)/alpha-ketoglutarate-dependent arginine beta-hydroxylase